MSLPLSFLSFSFLQLTYTFYYQVLLALDYLLTQNIAHRDVRSDNLLINQQGILKLGKF
jgi:serine/threonine protein kinase